MYWFAYLLIVIFAVIEYCTGKKSKVTYLISFAVLTAMICLRYGQGMDYFSYKHLYYKPVHGEIGFTFVSGIFAGLGIPFEIFLASVSLFLMAMIHRFIRLFSPMPMLSLVLFYPTIYLTYYYSAIRQAVAIAIFLGFMVKWLKEDKIIQYICGCFLLMLFHSSSFVLIILVVLKYFPVKKLYYFLPVSITIGLVLYLPRTQKILKGIPQIKPYISDSELSVFGILERIVLFGIITLLYYCVKEKGSHSFSVLLYKIYIVGFLISMATFPYSLLCSRMAAPFKAVELILIPIFLCEVPAFRKLVFTFILAYTALMLAKNLTAYINQTYYYKDINFLNYPYVSVFDKEITDYYHSGWDNILDK